MRQSLAKPWEVHKTTKPPHFALYFGAFRPTERNAFITFLEYLLVVYCRWREQSWGSGGRGTGPPNSRTKGPEELRHGESMQTKGLEELFIGWLKEAALGLWCRQRLCVLENHWSTTMCGPQSQLASSENHAFLNRKRDALLVTALQPGKKSPRNKDPPSHPQALLLGRYPLKRSKEPAWVYSSSVEDNRLDRWRRTKDKRTMSAEGDEWV